MRWILIILMLLVAGCGTRTEMREVERQVGTVDGKPTDLTVTRERQERTQVDLAAELSAVKALVAGVRGDLPAAVAALIPKPEPMAKPLEIGQVVASMMPKPTGVPGEAAGGLTAATLAALAWALREYLSKRQYKKTVLSELQRKKREDNDHA